MIWWFAILFTDYTTACLRYKCGSGTEFGLLEVYGSGDYKTSYTIQVKRSSNTERRISVKPHRERGLSCELHYACHYDWVTGSERDKTAGE